MQGHAAGGRERTQASVCPSWGFALRANAEDRSLAFGPGLHGCSHLMAVQTSEFT